MHILMRKHEKWNIVEAMYDKSNIANIYFVPRFKYIDVKTLQLNDSREFNFVLLLQMTIE